MSKVQKSIPMKKIVERVMASKQATRQIHIMRIVNELEKVTQKVEALEKLSVTRNPLETPAAHTKRLADKATVLKKESAALREYIQEQARQGLNSLQKEIFSASGLRQNAYAAEIRQAVLRMSADDRNELFNQILKTGDTETLAAITEAPGILSGVTTEQQEAMREAVFRMKAPELVADRDYTLEMISTSLSIADLAEKSAVESFNPEELQRIEQDVLAAENAQSELDKAFNPLR